MPLLHSEQPKLYGVLSVLSAIGLKNVCSSETLTMEAFKLKGMGTPFNFSNIYMKGNNFVTSYFAFLMMMPLKLRLSLKWNNFLKEPMSFLQKLTKGRQKWK